MPPFTPTRPTTTTKPRTDTRTLLHFDYDCFYASVVEAARPDLKTQPLAIQQKQIIVTCNYAARRRGLHKLQLITEARRVCPDVVIVLGEDLTAFRDASKALYRFLRNYSWNGKVERLGFDEVWMDVTDIVAANVGCLNRHDLGNSYFQISRDDPTEGFAFDAARFAGYVWPADGLRKLGIQRTELTTRLLVASHLAMHLRHRLEEDMGYTSTVGVSTNRLLSKLVGNVHKPRGQTTLVPPYECEPGPRLEDNVQSFMDGLDVGAVPWIGFKSAQKVREAVLRRPADFQTGLVYGGSKEAVTVEMVRKMEGLSPETLEKMLAGPGQPKGIGAKVWGLLHGIDDSEVAQAKNVPRQISIEDSYIRLDTMKQLTEELVSLSARLLDRMRVDLTEESDEHDTKEGSSAKHSRIWIGRPHTLRLTTRPRLPMGADGTRPRTFKRISRTGQMPSFVFSLEDNLDALAERLVSESLMPLFKKLHPEKNGWNLSLVNVAATDMMETGSDSKAAVGRNIQSMFSKQETVLKDFQITEEEKEEEGVEDSKISPDNDTSAENVDMFKAPQNIVDEDAQGVERVDDADFAVSLFKDDDDIEEDLDEDEVGDETPGSQEFECSICGEVIPGFAAETHERHHLDAG